MNTRISRLLGAAAISTLAAGCAGGTSSLPHAATQSAASSGNVTLSIYVPTGTTQSGHRAPLHLPTTTKSLKIIINNSTTPVVANLSPGQNTVSVTAPAGTDSFELYSYDAVGASGNQLSHFKSNFTVVAGKANVFPFTMGGIVAHVSFANAPVYEGATVTTAAPATGSVVASDADNNVIVGPFDSPVSVTASGVVSITGGGATIANSGDTFTYSYTEADPAPATPDFAFDAKVGTTDVTSGTAAATNANTISPGRVALWYDAANASTITGGPSAVSAWNDRSGNGVTVTQASAAAQPAVGTLNTKPALSFAAPGKFLANGNGFPSGDWTIFAVAAGTQLNSAHTNGVIVGGGVGSAGSGYGYALSFEPAASGTGVVLCLYEQQVCNDPATPNTPSVPLAAAPTGAYLVAAAVGGTTGSITYNAGTPVVAPVNPVNDTSIVINGFDTLGQSSATNTIGEVIVLGHSATVQEKAAYTSYLKAKWNLP